MDGSWAVERLQPGSVANKSKSVNGRSISSVIAKSKLQSNSIGMKVSFIECEVWSNDCMMLSMPMVSMICENNMFNQRVARRKSNLK